MDNEQKFWLLMILGLASIVGTTIIAVTQLNNSQTIEMAKAGYEQVLLPGQTQVVWQRRQSER